MLMIPSYLAPSSIHGIGVFAALPIAKGTLVWAYDERVDWCIPAHDMERFPEPYQEKMRMYSSANTETTYILCGDNGRFMNHSANPNCCDTPISSFALRDIAAGEELTCDYATFDLEFAQYQHLLST